MEHITMRLDRATAQDLHDLLFVYGQHLSAGAPIVPLTPAESARIGALLEHLGRELSGPPLPPPPPIQL